MRTDTDKNAQSRSHPDPANDSMHDTIPTGVSPSAVGSGTIPDRGGRILTVGLGTAVVMWWVGYLTHLPVVRDTLGGPVVFAALVICLIAGGALAGRVGAPRRASAGALAGLLTAAINLLCFGAKIAEGWTGGALELIGAVALFLVGGALLGGVAAVVLGRGRDPGQADWRGRLGWVAASATLLLLATGGLVTTQEVGMAVLDWPTTEGANMFLYPLAKMTGGVYFEHAHRLFGSLVGLSVMIWGVYTWRVARERRVRVAAVVLFGMVCLQGLMGGFRVTLDSRALAAVHGVFGQLTFAFQIGLALVASRVWRDAADPEEGTGDGDRALGRRFVLLLVAQLALGSLLRHYGPAIWLFPHIVVAVGVFFAAVIYGARLMGVHEKIPPVRRSGMALIGIVIAQFGLGFLALLAVGLEGDRDASSAYEILVPTGHQVLGALVLASGVFATVWVARFHRPGQPDPSERDAVPAG